jgi:hypothetical protein
MDDNCIKKIIYIMNKVQKGLFGYKVLENNSQSFTTENAS